MKPLQDKVFIRITKESRDGIFSKEIVRDDGTKVRLWLNVEAGDEDDRRSTLFVQTGIVEAVSDKVADIMVGDIAIVDYKLSNMDDHIVSKDGEDIVYWLNASTTYHKEDYIIYASRSSRRDQMAWAKGDYDNLSMLLGVLHGDRVLAREPYVFLEHESNVKEKVTESGIIYTKTERVYVRKVLASSPESKKKYGIQAGDILHLHDNDVFVVKVNANMTFDCVCDADVLAYDLIL